MAAKGDLLTQTNNKKGPSVTNQTHISILCLSLILSTPLLSGTNAIGQQDAKAAAAAAPFVDPKVVVMSDGVERKGPEGTTEAYLPILYPSSHAANLIELRNGDLLCFWFSGTWEGDSQVGIVMSRLAKGSHQWSPTVLIDRHRDESYQNPVPFQAGDGTLYLFHTTQIALQGEANSRVLELKSKDNGKTWTEPEVLFAKPGSYTRHRVLVLSDHSWLMPLNYQTSAGIGEGSETNYSAVKISKDSGTTWTECPMPGSEGKIQPTIVQFAPDKMTSFFRSRRSDFIYSSTSADGCKWTALKPTVLPNNNASIQALLLKDGRLTMVFNNSSLDRSGPKAEGGLRKPLSIAMSEDQGATWSFVRDIEVGRAGLGEAEQRIKAPGREEYSYPSVLQRSDGRVFVVFTYRRQTIKVVSFQESWIRNGGTVGVYKGNNARP
jgi:predicted neuraminidase